MKKEFTPLDLPKKGVSPTESRYRVYKDAKEFSVVDAPSALQALQASGLKTAYRIERDSIFAGNLVDLKKLPDAPPPAAAAAPAAPAAPEEAKPAEPDKGLSGAEVDQLLKG
jgi:hypothetical protein